MTDAQFIAWLKSADCIRHVLVDVVASISGVETTLKLSNRGFVPYESCIVGGVEFVEQLSFDGQPNVSYGDIEIDNMGGARDAWLDYVWTNRRIQIYIGDPRWVKADYRLVFDGVVGDIGSRSNDVLNLTLLDKLQRLNNPAIDTPLIPLTFGECHNVSPLLTNAGTLEFQVHDGAIEDVIEVRDNGLPVAITKSLSTGKFTLNQSPSGTITVSVQGDKPSAYTNTIAGIVQRLATGYGPASTRFSGGDLDTASLSAFDTAHPQPVGIFAPDRVNVFAACQELAASVGAQVVCTTQGLLRIVKLSLPAAGTPVEVGPADMDARSLQISERSPVKAACKLAYCRNWTIQASGLAGGVPPDNAALFAQEWLYSTATDSTTATLYKLDNQPVEEPSLLLVTADAATESARRRDMWKTPRTVVSARYGAHLMLTELGDAVKITHPRFGLAAGKTGIAVHVARSWLTGRITLGVLV